MTDQEIAALLRKLFDDTITIEEEMMLDEWYESIDDDEDSELSEAELNEMKERIWRSVAARTFGADRITVTALIPVKCLHDKGLLSSQNLN